MKVTRSSLFASSIVVAAAHLPTMEVSGFYDPSEQLWHYDGKVVAEEWQ